jgi:hypothetical protein
MADSADSGVEGTYSVVIAFPDCSISQTRQLCLTACHMFFNATLSLPPPILALPNPGRGGSGEGYIWTQTLADVSITVSVPEGTIGRAVHCEITERTMSMGLKDAGIEGRILNGELGGTVHPDDCMWSVDRTDNTVTIHLDKSDRMSWWDCVVKGEPVINVSKIEPDNSKLSDLDMETRGMVEKMMFDQRAKAAGQPTSDEKRQQDMLKKFQLQHPEMDFSGAKFQKNDAFHNM